MKTERHSIQYGEHRINFAIVRRQRTTLEIAVEPDTSVVVAAPRDAPLTAIKAKVCKRAAWIRRQQRYFIQFLPRTPTRKYVAGETHLYLGRQYKLKVVPHIQQAVKLKPGQLVVQSHKAKSNMLTKSLVEQWYRERAHVKMRERLDVCRMRFPDPQTFEPKSLVIRQLKKRWGSMTPKGTLIINRGLICASVDAIDYVITHELCHMRYNNHGHGFIKLLDRVMPDWQARKRKLEWLLA